MPTDVDVRTYIGDCRDVLQQLDPGSVDLVYVDPPFGTQATHRLTTRDGIRSYSFGDSWNSRSSYADFIYERISHARNTLSATGSIFFHCDKSSSHIVRSILDAIFGTNNFQSEIIWYFKRWSNARKGLLPAHQTIFFYSKTSEFKFNIRYQEYAPSTNVDQIMQKRSRDTRNKTVYARDVTGKAIGNGVKKGVPLSDVWEIPFLNPKAHERVGFPTQKPLILLKRIIELVTDEGDVVLDPFCGSGTTLVAARLLNRSAIGVDIAEDAIQLARARIRNPVMSQSGVQEKGDSSYRQHSVYASQHLVGVDYVPIQRNRGIDGLLRREIDGRPAFIRVQRGGESIEKTVTMLKKATQQKGDCRLIVVATAAFREDEVSHAGVYIIPSASCALEQLEERSVDASNDMPLQRRFQSEGGQHGWRL